MLHSKPPRYIAFEEIISPMDIDFFTREVFGKRDFLLTNSRCPPMDEISFEEAIWAHEQGLQNSLTAYPSSLQPFRPPRRRKSKDLFNWALERYAEGDALVLEGIENLLPWAACLASTTALGLLSRTSIHAIAMPPNSTVVREYTEPTDLIIMPTNGNINITSNNCALYNLSALQHVHQYPCIYISACNALTINAPTHSVVTFAEIEPLTMRDYLSVFGTVMTESCDDFRKSSHLDMDRTKTESVIIEKLSQNSKFLDTCVRRTKLKLVDKYRPLPLGGLRDPITLSPNINADTMLRLRPGMHLLPDLNPNGAYLYVSGLANVPEHEAQPGGLLFPGSVFELLEGVARMKQPFSADFLSDQFTIEARITLLKKLFSVRALELA